MGAPRPSHTHKLVQLRKCLWECWPLQIHMKTVMGVSFLPLCNDWTNGLPEIRHASAGPHKCGHPGPVMGTQRNRAFTSGGVGFAAMARPHHSADLKRETKALETAAIIAIATGLRIEIRHDLHENDRSSTGFVPPDRSRSWQTRSLQTPISR
jgi:hypothetical protein